MQESNTSPFVTKSVIFDRNYNQFNPGMLMIASFSMAALLGISGYRPVEAL